MITNVYALEDPVRDTGTVLAVEAVATNIAATGELTYTWQPVLPLIGPVVFDETINGTAAASHMPVTFSRAGTYVFEVAVEDSEGGISTDRLTVIVEHALISVDMMTQSNSIRVGQQGLFMVSSRNQFGQSRVEPVLSWSVSGGGVISPRGILTADAVGGPYTVTARLSDGGSVAAFFSVTANAPPHLDSLPTFSPNPATTLGVVSFAIGVSDADDAHLTVTWHFGDGSEPAVGTTASHFYATPGSYPVTVTVSDGLDALTQTLNVVVLDPAGRVHVKQLIAKVNAKRANNDSMKIVGGISPGLSGGMGAAGAEVTLNIGGVKTSFKIDAKGAGRNDLGTFQFNARDGFRTFKACLTGGNFAPMWLDEGVVSATEVRAQKSSTTMAVELVVGQVSYSGVVGLQVSSTLKGAVAR